MNLGGALFRSKSHLALPLIRKNVVSRLADRFFLPVVLLISFKNRFSGL